MLNQLLAQWQSRQDKTALIFREEYYTYQELYQLSSTLANNLYLHGLRKNSRIAFFMDNRPELIGLYFAAFSLGAIAVPINYRYKSEELLYILNNAQVDILVIEEKKVLYVTQLQQANSLSCKVFVLSQTSSAKYTESVLNPLPGFLAEDRLASDNLITQKIDTTSQKTFGIRQRLYS